MPVPYYAQVSRKEPIIVGVFSVSPFFTFRPRHYVTQRVAFAPRNMPSTLLSFSSRRDFTFSAVHTADGVLIRTYFHVSRYAANRRDFVSIFFPLWRMRQRQ